MNGTAAELRYLEGYRDGMAAALAMASLALDEMQIVANDDAGATGCTESVPAAPDAPDAVRRRGRSHQYAQPDPDDPDAGGPIAKPSLVGELRAALAGLKPEDEAAALKLIRENLEVSDDTLAQLADCDPEEVAADNPVMLAFLRNLMPAKPPKASPTRRRPAHRPSCRRVFTREEVAAVLASSDCRTVAEAVRHLQEAGANLDELAKLVGVSHSTLYNVAAGKIKTPGPKITEFFQSMLKNKE